MPQTDRLISTNILGFLKTSLRQGCIGLFNSVSKCTDFPSLSTPLVPRIRPFQCLLGEAVAFGIPPSNQGFPAFLKRLKHIFWICFEASELLLNTVSGMREA